LITAIALKDEEICLWDDDMIKVYESIENSEGLAMALHCKLHQLQLNLKQSLIEE
jgi:hypothetical protein